MNLGISNIVHQHRKKLNSSFYNFPENILLPRWWAVFVICVGFLALNLDVHAAQNPVAPPAQSSNEGKATEAKIDFRSEVLPILRSRCFECHSDQKVDGDLRLDSKLSVLKGGHTGNSILGESAADSELIRRILSTEKGYRMPKKDPPLSQEQITILTRWIDQGADWPVAQPGSNSNGTNPTSQSAVEWLADKYLLLQERPEFLYPTLVVLGLLLLFALMAINRFLKRRKLRNSGNSQLTDDQAKKELSIGQTIVVLFTLTALFGMGAVIAYQQGLITRLSKQKAPAAKQNPDLFFSTPVQSADDPPEHPRPMHPPRLGGLYYRGNDERSSELFNGGYYRTAELLVELVNKDDSKIEYGDKSSLNDVSISFTATRAKGATRALFTNRTLSQAYLSTSFKREESEADRIMLQPVVDGESWNAVYPLEKNESDSPAGSNSRLEGTLYVFFGPLDHNRIHYAIHYDLLIKDGAISEESEIWMGSVFNLAGRVMIPQGDRIALDRWYDFRPIPEIEGKNSDNPDLLGLPEHLPASGDSGH